MAWQHAWSCFSHPHPLGSNGTFPLVHSPSCWMAERDWFVEDDISSLFLSSWIKWLLSHWLLPSAVECHHVIGLELLRPYSVAECSLLIGSDHSYPLSSGVNIPLVLG
ncbi:unnamed protein product [Microthlaspi erraticum]|uniref:Uncharacterized protein n=1 Tax=Microthlaspi erraticum TaxID=1685480 RepID=A0A6D2HK94_9BRAS|nr:unnamed protein product [Microthlaspi erraticum]